MNNNVHYYVIGAVVFIAGYFIQKMIQSRQLFSENRAAWLRQTCYLFWKDWLEPFVIAGILALVIRTYLLGPYKIPTASMRPTLMEEDRIFVDKLSYRFRAPKRGEIIVFKYPLDPKKDYVKRLVGLAGDKIQIENGKILLNGKLQEFAPFSNFYYYNRDEWKWGQRNQTFEVPRGHYFALGDNSAQSSDSRNWGFIPEKNLVGRAFFIWWPPKRIKLPD